MTPQPPAVTYYKISPGPASLPAGSLMRQNNNQMHQPQYCPPQYAPIPQQMYYTGNGFVYPQCGFMNPVVAPQQMVSSHVGSSGQGPQMKHEFSDLR